MFIKRNISRKKFLKVTVIVPIYLKTTKKDLLQCLNSIYNSSKVPGEILICIDGKLSTNVEEFVKKLKKEKNVKLFISKKNLGLGRLLQRAVPVCKFDLVARLDSDEYTSSKRFEIQYDFFKKMKDLVLLGGYSIEKLKNTKNILKKVPLKYSEIKYYSKLRNPFNHSTVMFRKKEILKVGGYTHQPFFEDFLLWIKLINKKNNMLNIPKVLSYSNIDDSYYERRSGIDYFYKFLYFNIKIYKLRHLNIFYFILNIFFRLSVLLPLNIIKLMYMKLLRNE